jgi:hypothetical protein
VISSIDSLIARHGNVVRSGIARPATIARYLAEVDDVEGYRVTYWRDGMPQRMTAEEFLTLYQAGRIPEPLTRKERECHPGETKRRRRGEW